MTGPAPLVLSGDPVLLDDVTRLAAVSGLDPVVAAAPSRARPGWGAAGAVVVGADVLADAARAGLPRRPGVVVASYDDPTPEVWRAAVAVGAEEVVLLPRDESALMARLAAGTVVASARARVVGVLGASGGAGASVVAVALALAGVRLDRSVVLVDLDPLAGGLDLALAAEGVPGARWPELAAVTGPVAPGTLLPALPEVAGLRLLAGSRDPVTQASPVAVDAVLETLGAAVELVVLDLPRAHPDVVAAAIARCDVVLLVATPDVRGAAAARATVARWRGRCDLRLVVRHVAGTGLEPGQLADWLELPLAAEVAHEPRLTPALDRGEVPGHGHRSRLGRVATDLATVLLER